MSIGIPTPSYLIGQILLLREHIACILIMRRALRESKQHIDDVDDDPCGYCGTSQNPNDICRRCFDSLT